MGDGVHPGILSTSLIHFCLNERDERANFPTFSPAVLCVEYFLTRVKTASRLHTVSVENYLTIASLVSLQEKRCSCRNSVFDKDEILHQLEDLSWL